MLRFFLAGYAFRNSRHFTPFSLLKIESSVFDNRLHHYILLNSKKQKHRLGLTEYIPAIYILILNCVLLLYMPLHCGSTNRLPISPKTSVALTTPATMHTCSCRPLTARVWAERRRTASSCSHLSDSSTPDGDSLTLERHAPDGGWGWVAPSHWESLGVIQPAVAPVVRRDSPVVGTAPALGTIWWWWWGLCFALLKCFFFLYFFNIWWPTDEAKLLTSVS